MFNLKEALIKSFQQFICFSIISGLIVGAFYLTLFFLSIIPG